MPEVPLLRAGTGRSGRREKTERRHPCLSAQESTTPKGRSAAADEEEAGSELPADVRGELGEDGDGDDAAVEAAPAVKTPALRSRAVQKPLPFTETDITEEPDAAAPAPAAV